MLTDQELEACFDGLMPSGSGKSRYDIARAVLVADRAKSADLMINGLTRERSERLQSRARDWWGTKSEPAVTCMPDMTLTERMAAAACITHAQAQAALEAMLEPTQSMKDAANKLPELFSMGDEWTAMIDAALKESP